jgi:hypothetical protein
VRALDDLEREERLREEPEREEPEREEPEREEPEREDLARDDADALARWPLGRDAVRDAPFPAKPERAPSYAPLPAPTTT